MPSSSCRVVKVETFPTTGSTSASKPTPPNAPNWPSASASWTSTESLVGEFPHRALRPRGKGDRRGRRASHPDLRRDPRAFSDERRDRGGRRATLSPPAGRRRNAAKREEDNVSTPTTSPTRSSTARSTSARSPPNSWRWASIPIRASPAPIRGAARGAEGLAVRRSPSSSMVRERRPDAGDGFP